MSRTLRTYLDNFEGAIPQPVQINLKPIYTIDMYNLDTYNILCRCGEIFYYVLTSPQWPAVQVAVQNIVGLSPQC